MTTINEAMKRMASKVRHLRQAQGMSLTALAERSGVAKSTLAQIEAATSNPTLTTLLSLSEALSTRIEDLIIGAPEDERMVVVRAGQGADMSDETMDGQLVRSIILGPSVIEFYQMTVKAEKSEVSASHGFGAREHVIVARGNVKAGPLGEEETILHPGDYASYSAAVPHRWAAVDGEATIWVIVTYPRAAES